MKNIHPIMLEKYADDTQYEKMGDYIYKKRADKSICTALSCDLEEGEDSQYPLEDLLDKFYVNITNYYSLNDTARQLSFEVEGSLDDVEENYAHILEVSRLRVF
ncbi:MAG: hypothetical protein LBV79_10235 [Candidatus Adiutrix sp.]|jgi:hypothetical protein|nr:hypothetical protein [Candidatus Adiutrix sp.]